MPGTENGFMEVSMNTRRKQILTVVGITAFAVLIIVLFLFAIKQRDAYASGDLGSIQHTTLGTIKKMDLFDYFVADEEKRPLPVWSAEVLGKENPNSNISRLNFVSAEGEILSIENENPHYMVVMAELENIGETEITLEAAWTLPEPGEYYEEGQKIRFYYEPPRENRIPGSVYIGSYEEQIIVLE